jgi:hypothetical protein
VTVSGTEQALMKYLLKTIGAGAVTNKRTYKEHHTPSFTYAIYSRQALNLLEQILPYLQTYKSKRAYFVLDRYVKVTPRNGKYNDKQRKERKKFVEAFFTILPQK